MKLHNRLFGRISIAVALPAVLSAGIILLGISSADAAPDSTAPTGVTGTPGAVVSPAVPATISFAGDIIDLDRRDMYERMDRELTAIAFTHGNMLLTIKRANRYFPEMEPILKRNGVPSDLLYLACIESWLDPRARSGAGAAGVWQIMPATAKQLGLEVNDSVDERYNLELATDAACRLLKQNLNRFGGKWESAAAAYNGGPTRVSRELDAQLAESAYDLYLTEETSRYIFRLLAMKAVMENPANYGFELSAESLYQPVEYDTETVTTTIPNLTSWAAQRGLTYLELRDHNPWLRGKSLPNKSGKRYTIRIPKRESLRRSTAPRHVYNPSWISASKPIDNTDL